MKLCKTTSVFYYFLAFLYAVAAGGAILGWILSGAASVMFGDLGMVLISAVIIAALVLIFGFIFIYVHGALLLRAPRREDTPSLRNMLPVYSWYLHPAAVSSPLCGLCRWLFLP